MGLAPVNPMPKDRLERFRGFRARLDPSGDPAHAMERFYVADSRSVSARIAAELAISPASSHLLIGGIGSGKTTELLAAQRQVSQIDDMLALYIDVSKQHDIAKLPSGEVITQVGAALCTALEAQDHPAALAARDLFQRHSRARYHEAFERSASLSWAARELSRLEELLQILRDREAHLVVLLDGLDRMTEIESFERLVDLDVKALSSAGVGVVLVGPLRGLYGVDRTVVQQFDSFHYQPWIDVTRNSEGAAFLDNVLRRRVPEAFDPSEIETLVRASGGVLRDLLALAQSALVEAYMDGADRVNAREVSDAIDAFGRKHLQGLRPAEIEALQRVRTRGVFVHTSEDDLALLMTRRVLEYRAQGELRYAVHPTIQDLLQQLGEK